jgi:cystathionine beta-lyase
MACTTELDPLTDFDLGRLRQRTSMKWATFPSDVLPLWVAEMDTSLPAVVRARLDELLDMADMGYASDTVLAQAWEAFAADRWGWQGLAANPTRQAAGVLRGLTALLRAVTPAGSAVVLDTPAYGYFFKVLADTGRRAVQVPLTGSARLDLDGLERAFAAGAAAYVLCSPHNPTGTVHSADELRAVAQLAAAHSVRVIADEIHGPFVPREREFVPYLTVSGSESAFSLLSATKGWNLVALPAALIVAGTDASDELASINESALHGTSHLGELVHATALTEARDWLDAVVDRIERNRRMVTDALLREAPQVRHRPGAATAFAWLDLRATGLGDDPAAILLERGRVALSPGPSFGAVGAGHARLNLATSEAVLREALDRILGVLAV